MFYFRILLKSSILVRKLAKRSPVLKRQLNRLSLALALKAVSKAMQEPRPCGRACGCVREG